MKYINYINQNQENNYVNRNMIIKLSMILFWIGCAFINVLNILVHEEMLHSGTWSLEFSYRCWNRATIFQIYLDK